jgi:8-oxo-dGTP diphosphatase
MVKELKTPILTVDAVVLTLSGGRLAVALQRRDKQPFKGERALIGGYVRPGEDANARATAERVLAQKAQITGMFIEQLMTFSGAFRDPRGWSASVVYIALVPEIALRDQAGHLVELVPVDAVGVLPFDHGDILAAALARLRTKGAYSSLPAFLLGDTFTLADLRRIYERVLGVTLNDSAFRRKIEEQNVLEEVPGAISKVTARPAQLFRLKETKLHEFDRKI